MRFNIFFNQKRILFKILDKDEIYVRKFLYIIKNNVTYNSGHLVLVVRIINEKLSKIKQNQKNFIPFDVTICFVLKKNIDRKHF